MILLDWWLPGIDGLQLLERFRQAGGTTPVLFLTARDAISDRVRGLDGGDDDYLCKPFAFKELLARVRSLARRPGGRACRPGRCRLSEGCSRKAEEISTARTSFGAMILADWRHRL